MAAGEHTAGQDLVKQELITREELERAHAVEEKSGTPWYRALVQWGKLSYDAIEDTLRYEFHPPALRAEHQSLGDTLVEQGVLTEKQLDEALAEQRRSGRLMGNILLERKAATREQIGRALAKQYEMEFAQLSKTPSEEPALEAVPESIARKHQMIPVTLEGDRLIVLVTSPQVRNRVEDAAVLLGKRIHPIMTASKDIRVELQKRYRALASDGNAQPATSVVPRGRLAIDEVVEVPAKSNTPAAAVPPKAASSPASKKKGAATKKSAAKAGPKPQPAASASKETSAMPAATATPAVLDDAPNTFEEIARQASGSSVIKMVQTIIEGAVNAHATDVHLDPQDPEMRVRYRIDGVLHDVMSIPNAIEPAVVSRIKIMADLDITESRHPQDGRISMTLTQGEWDVRVATLPTYLGERVVLRLLDQSSILSGIKDLGLEPDDEKTLGRLIDLPYGMILVTGPTGSGKTTTLYASLNQKNVMTDSIVTLEDPVEYQLSGINQVQIETDIGVTFANTLRAALRQDIDVLLVGEIRDSETARIAIRAAMTGHLVFSTLHTNDAPEAISTLRNMDVPSYLISSALSGVIGQRLVRAICPDCRKGFKPSASLLKSLDMPASTSRLYRGAGCISCYGTGNKGRTGVFEILEVTTPIRKMIAEDEHISDIAKAAALKSIANRCQIKLKKGVISPEEYIRVVRS